jgi:hypothetical protein
VLSGQNLKAGAVVGRVSRGIGRVSIPTVVGTGNGTVSQVFAGPDVEVGNYVLTCTAAVANGGVFSLTSPSGKALPALTMTPGAGGTTKSTRSRHINFTITDGATTSSSATCSPSSSARRRRPSSAAPAPALCRRWRSVRREAGQLPRQHHGGRPTAATSSRGGPDGIRSAVHDGHAGSAATTFTSRADQLHDHGRDRLHRRQLLRRLRVQPARAAARSSRGIRPRSTAATTSSASCSTT